MTRRPAHRQDFAVVKTLLRLGPETGSQGREEAEFGAQLGPGCQCVQHGQQGPTELRKVKKVRTELAKRIRHERSKGQTRIMVSREAFGSFVMLHVGNVLWFELMRGGVGMPLLEVHDKQSAGAEVKPRVRTD